MNKYWNFLLFFLLVLPVNFVVFSQQEVSMQETLPYVIASGSRGGNYFKTGNYIATTFNKAGANQFISIESGGSKDNIELLKENYADFAIVQRNVLLSSLYNESNGINNIEVISPLFEEKLLIYYRQKKALSISEFQSKIQQDSIRFGFTSKKSYSYDLYKLIFRYLGIDQSKIKAQQGNYKDLISRFKEGKLDVIVSFSLPINELDNLDACSLVYFEKDEIALLEGRIPNLFATSVEQDILQKTLGSWAFLIGRKDKIKVLENPKDVFESLVNNSKSKHNIGELIQESVLLFKTNKNWDTKLLKGIPINEHLENKLDYYTFNSKRFFSALVFFIFLLVLFYILNKRHLLPHISYLHLWHRYKHIFIGIIILGGLYFLSVVVLQISEQNFYIDVGIKSQLLNLSENDLHFWLLIRNLTGIDSGINPLSTSGKLALSFVSYLLWIGTLIIALSEYIAYQISKKRKQGLMKINLENHIVIIGWNDTTNTFIKDTISAAKEYNGKKEKIICIARNPEVILEKHKTIKELHSERKLHFVKGETRDKLTLEKANIHKAKTVVLLAEDNSQKADEKTLLRALAITRFCRRKAMEKEVITDNDSTFETYNIGHYIDEIYIIAEINDAEFKNDLMEADVNEVIVSASYAKGVITQSILNHGISKVVDELLQFNEYNEFYTVDLALERNQHLRDKTYDELLLPLRKQRILLVAIKVVYHNDKDNKEIIDEHEITKLLKKEGLGRQIIVNPITDKEINRPTDEDDQLIVFSTDRKALKEQLELVVFN